MATRRNYGAKLRIYDTGKDRDRYTLVPPCQARRYMTRDRRWHAVASGVCPAGNSYHCEVFVGPHLGTRIDWSELPGDVQQLAHAEWPEFTPAPDQLTSGQQEALDHFKRRHGKAWKEELSAAWTSGRDAVGVYGPFLRQIRNTLGPAWLARQK